MAKYVLKRLILAFITAIIIIIITFFLIKLIPFEKPIGTNAQRFAYYMHQESLGYIRSYTTLKPELGDYIEKIKLDDSSSITYYFYETPIFEQFFYWIRNIITKWDWGVSLSIQMNVDAMQIILKRLPTTIKINFWSVIFSVPLGILLGIWAALKKNKATDNIISTTVMVLVSVPGFVLITFVLLLFCYTLHWFPTQWPKPEHSDVDKFLGYFVPVFVLSLGSICGYCRAIRAELCEVMESEYLLLARTKGLTKQQSIIRHALRNAMVPIVPSILAEVIGLLGGSMILENLYGIPGIGSLYIDSITFKDYNVLFFDMAFFEVISLLAGILFDLSYGFIDPRIRMGAKNK